MIHNRLERELKEIISDLIRVKESYKKTENLLDQLSEDDFFKKGNHFPRILDGIISQTIFVKKGVIEWETLIDEIRNTRTKKSNQTLFNFIKRIDTLNEEKTSPIISYAAILNLLALNFAFGIFKNPGKSQEFAIDDQQKRKEIAEIAENLRLISEEIRHINENILKLSDELKSTLIAAYKELGIKLNMFQRMRLS